MLKEIIQIRTNVLDDVAIIYLVCNHGKDAFNLFWTTTFFKVYYEVKKEVRCKYCMVLFDTTVPTSVQVVQSYYQLHFPPVYNLYIWKRPGMIYFMVSFTRKQQRPRLYVKPVPEMITTSHALVHTSAKKQMVFYKQSLFWAMII